MKRQGVGRAHVVHMCLCSLFSLPTKAPVVDDGRSVLMVFSHPNRLPKAPSLNNTAEFLHSGD